MNHLRRSTIFLLLGLAIFFNIERLDFGHENIIDISTFVYIFGILAVISVLILPVFWHSSVFVPLVMWAGIYLVGKTMISDDHPLLGGIHTYISITEIAFLAVLIWLAHIVARTLYDFEEAVENITLTDLDRRIRHLPEANEEIQLELTRSRRHHHPLSVVVVEPDPESIKVALHHTILEVQRAMMTRYVITSLARVFGSVLRRIDLVIEEQDKGRFIILCPETDAEGSKVVAERIQIAAANKLGVSVEYGAASFPDQALTFEELLSQAESQIKQPEAQTEFSTHGSAQAKGVS